MTDSLNVYEDAARTARIEYLRLKGISVSVITDEQIAKAVAKNPNFKPSASFKVEWEPLSYRLEGGRYGNLRTEYLPFTFGLDADQLAAVRAMLWRGAGTVGRRMTIPNNVGEARQPWQVFMVKAKAAGLDISVNPDTGDVYSKDVDKVFAVEAGYITLPARIQDPAAKGGWRDSDPSKGEKAYTPYVRIPVEKVDNYVQPEDVPVIFVQSSDDDTTPAMPAATSTATATGVTPEALAAALAEAGLIGERADSFDTAAKQINVTNRFGAKAPVLFSSEVQTAAAAGGLIDYAIAKGAITVDDGVIVKAA